MPALTPEQMRQLAVARAGGSTIRWCRGMALFDAYTIALFALISILSGYNSLPGLFIGFGLGIVAWVEFRAVAALGQLKPEAVRHLGYNQLALAAVLIVYAVWNLALPGQNGIAAAINAAGADPQTQQQLRQMLGGDAGDFFNWLIYGSLIAIAVFVQGGTALYYLSREKRVRAYVEQTPDWIQQMQKAGVRV
jgi:hypothetical protein